MRTLTALVTVVVLATGVSACSKKHGAKNVYACPNKGSDVGFSGVKKGKVTVETTLPSKEFWVGSDVESLTGGYEFNLAEDLCGALGVSRVRIVDQPRSAITTGHTTDYDLALAQLSTTAGTKAVEFSTGYLPTDQGIVANPGTAVPNLAAAKKLKWGVETGTTSGAFIKNTVNPTTPAKAFSSETALFGALKAKTIDAIMIYTPVALANDATNTVGQFSTHEEFGVLLPKSSPNTKLVNTALAKLKSDGTLDALSKKWLTGSPSSVPVIAAP